MPPTKKKVKVIPPKTDWKRETLDWNQVYVPEYWGVGFAPEILKLRKHFIRSGLTLDDITYCMGFARSEDNTYNKRQQPKAIPYKNLLEFAKYPWKYNFAKKHYTGIARVIEQKIKAGTLQKKLVDPTDAEYDAYMKKKDEKHNAKVEHDNYEAYMSHTVAITRKPRMELGRIVSEMAPKEKKDAAKKVKEGIYALDPKDRKNSFSFFSMTPTEFKQIYDDGTTPISDSFGGLIHPSMITNRRYRRHFLSFFRNLVF